MQPTKLLLLSIALWKFHCAETQELGVSCPLIACRLFCEFGFERDERGCHRCACINPCNVVDCAPGFTCVVEPVSCNNPPCDPSARAACRPETTGSPSPVSPAASSSGNPELTQPSLICSLPRSRGPCLGRLPRWHFNPSTGDCEKFIFGGCRGNSNNYRRKFDCEVVCQGITSEPPPVPTTESAKVLPGLCLQPAQPGVCRGFFPRWFFNTQTGHCEGFIYGGCRGNSNNFLTRESCELRCPSPITTTTANPVTSPQSFTPPSSSSTISSSSSSTLFSSSPSLPASSTQTHPSLPSPENLALCPRRLCAVWSLCAFGAALDDKGCPTCTCAFNPCMATVCDSGTVCEVANVQCIKSPCNPVAMCVPERGSGVSDNSKPGTCPFIPGGVFGICIEACRDDSSCPGDMKCCSNGCGLTCAAPVAQTSITSSLSTPVLQTETPRPGLCPPASMWGVSGSCEERCDSDTDCPGVLRCCHNGCGSQCARGLPPRMIDILLGFIRGRESMEKPGIDISILKNDSKCGNKGHCPDNPEQHTSENPTTRY